MDAPPGENVPPCPNAPPRPLPSRRAAEPVARRDVEVRVRLSGVSEAGDPEAGDGDATVRMRAGETPRDAAARVVRELMAAGRSVAPLAWELEEVLVEWGRREGALPRLELPDDGFAMYEGEAVDEAVSRHAQAQGLSGPEAGRLAFRARERAIREGLEPAASVDVSFLVGGSPPPAAVDFYEGDDWGRVAGEFARGAGLGRAQASMLRHRAQALRHLALNDDGYVGAGAVRVDQARGWPHPGARAPRAEDVREPPARKPSAGEALGWPVYVVARSDIDEESVALLERRLAAGGLTGPVTWASGQVDLGGTPWGPLGLTGDHRANLGLTVAHVYVLLLVGEGATPAWVLEDDVVLHDRFPELFPEYWGDPRVAADFEYVSVGGVPVVPWGLPEEVEGIPRVGLGPSQWGTQSYIVSPSGAQRLARVFDALVAVARGAGFAGGWGGGGRTLLPPHDSVADGLQAHAWALMGDDERHRLLTFLSPPDAPAEVHGFRWRTPAQADVRLSVTGNDLAARAFRTLELSQAGVLKGDCRRPPPCQCEMAFTGYFTTGLTFQSGCVPYHTDVHNTWDRFVRVCGGQVARGCLDLWECQFRGGGPC